MKKRKKNLVIDKSWTLFLDRDGVINKHIKDGYVLKWKDFQFLPLFLKNISTISEIFGKVIVVTNQRCIARKLLTKSKLRSIHNKMLKRIKAADGRINKIYICPHDIKDNCKCRKPKIGMALKAKKQFKNIKFSKSIIIGDSNSDIEFGKKCKMTTVLCSKNTSFNRDVRADFVISNFNDFLKLIDY